MKKFLITNCFLLILGISLAFAGSQQTSQTTAQTIIDRTRYQLNEQISDFWSDEEMLVWLNDGTVDIIAKSQCLQTTYDLMLIDGQLEYLIPNSTKYIGAVDAMYMSVTGKDYLLKQDGGYILQQNGDKLILGFSFGTDKKGLIRGELRNVGHRSDGEEPICWYEWDGRIGVYPLANTDIKHDIVRIFLIERPDVVILSDDVLIPAYYDYALELYIIARALYKDRKMNTGKQIMKEYLEEIDRFRGDFK